MTPDRNISSSGRLRRHFRHAGLALLAITTAGTGARSRADVMYTPVDWVIPANSDGIYIDVELLATRTSGEALPGWDLNPYGSNSLAWFNAVGTGMMLYPGLTTGSASSLSPGTIVGPTARFGQGSVVVGEEPGMWRVNDSNYFGFRFRASDGQAHCGWGRLALGSSIDGVDRRITDIAWETNPNTPIEIPDLEGGSDYEPCATWNPVLTTGMNALPHRQTVADFAATCGTIVAANFHRFDPLVTGEYTFRACNEGAAVRLALLSRCDASGTELVCGTPACGKFGVSATIVLTDTTPIYLVVGSAFAKAPLDTNIELEVLTPPVPACVDAPFLSFGVNPFETNGPTSQTVRSNAIGTATATMHRAAWYRFVPAVTGAYSLRTCGSTGDSNLAIDTECPPVGQRFEAIAFNDDAPNCPTSSGLNYASFIDATNNGASGQYGGFPLTEDLVAGNTYLILVGSYTAASTSNGILVIDGPPQGSPTDPDADGLPNALDNCPDIFNPNQADCDADGTGDVCEITAGAADINVDSIPDTCQCIADIFPDGVVNGADLGVLLSQ